jgi:hypothetical protein
LPFKALQQLQHGATELYEEVVSRVSQKSGMRLFEACSKAAELTQGLYGPLFGQLDPAHLAESARGLEIGVEYAERVLKRYRPALWAAQGPKLLDRLVHGYPTHGFTIDQEEAQDLGIPTRIPDEQEAALLDQLALAMIEYGTTSDLITLVAGFRLLRSPPRSRCWTAAGWESTGPHLPERRGSAPRSPRREG